MGNGYQTQQGYMGNWQGSQMNMNQQCPTQQPHGHQYNPQQMGMMANMGYMGNQNYQRYGMMPSAQMMQQMPLNAGRDVQCGDVSQSSQSKGAKQSAKNSPRNSNKSSQKKSPNKQD